MLRALAERYPLAVVTSRSQREAAAFLAQYGLSDLFHVIITCENAPGALSRIPCPCAPPRRSSACRLNNA